MPAATTTTTTTTAAATGSTTTTTVTRKWHQHPLLIGITAIFVLRLLGVHFALGAAIVALIGGLSALAEYLEPDTALKRYVRAGTSQVRSWGAFLVLYALLQCITGNGAIQLLNYLRGAESTVTQGTVAFQFFWQVILIAIAWLASRVMVQGRPNSWSQHYAAKYVYLAIALTLGFAFWSAYSSQITTRAGQLPGATLASAYWTKLQQSEKAWAEKALADPRWGVAKVTVKLVSLDDSSTAGATIEQGDIVMRKGDAKPAPCDNGLTCIEVVVAKDGDFITSKTFGRVDMSLFDWSANRPGLEPAKAEKKAEEAQAELTPHTSKVVEFNSGKACNTGLKVSKGDKIKYIGPTAPFEISDGGSSMRQIESDAEQSVTVPGSIILHPGPQSGKVQIVIN